MDILKNKLIWSSFIDANKDKNDIGLSNLHHLVSIDITKDAAFEQKQDYNIEDIELHIPLKALDFEFSSEVAPLETYTCYSYPRTSNFQKYIEGVVKRNRGEDMPTYRTDYWSPDSCHSSYNATHFT